MTAVKKLNLVSVEDYLKRELGSQIKHEYLAGVVYAMAGAGTSHNRIAGSFLISIGGQLRGKPCEAFNSDMKVRVRLAAQTRFYHPDGMIVCPPTPPSGAFQDHPSVIAEVLSATTRRTDEGEKKDAYLTIPSLSAYLLIESSRPRVVVHRRGEGGNFVAEVYEGLDAVIPLDDVGCSLALAELYERVDFAAAEREDAEDGESMSS
jgi:Uma2 family endonuclease